MKVTSEVWRVMGRISTLYFAVAEKYLLQIIEKSHPVFYIE